MLDIRFIRENHELVRENIKKKFQDAKLPLVDEVKEAIENVLILATQCSKPDTTNAIITQNMTMSLPLSDFMRVP